MAKYALLAKLVAHEGKREELLGHLLSATEIMKDKARGCELYFVSVASDDDVTIVVTELWTSEADHKASLEIPGIMDTIKAGRPLIASHEMQRLTPRGGVNVSV